MKTKVIHLKEDKFEGRISLDTCKRVLKAKAKDLSDKEVYRIRDLLYALADIDFQLYQEHQQKKTANIIELNTEQYETQSYPLHPRIHRRAS